MYHPATIDELHYASYLDLIEEFKHLKVYPEGTKNPDRVSLKRRQIM